MSYALNQLNDELTKLLDLRRVTSEGAEKFAAESARQVALLDQKIDDLSQGIARLTVEETPLPPAVELTKKTASKK